MHLFLFLFLFYLTPLIFLPLGITLGWSACQIIEISLMCFSVSYHREESKRGADRAPSVWVY